MTAKSHMLMVGPVAILPIYLIEMSNKGFIEKFLSVSNEIELLVLFYSILIGSLFPDIDEPNSAIGRKSFIISHFLNIFFGHRTITHTLLVIIVCYSFSFAFIGYIEVFLIGLAIGIFVHCVGDMLVKETLSSFFYPAKITISLLPEILRFSTGGVVENFVIIPLLVISDWVILKVLLESKFFQF